MGGRSGDVYKAKINPYHYLEKITQNDIVGGHKIIIKTRYKIMKNKKKK